MAKLFTLGLITGITIPSYLSLKDYDMLYDNLYFPHKRFRILKQKLKRDDLVINEDDYMEYFKTTFKSLYNLIYYFSYGKSQELLLAKQNACYDLIEQFEFMKETSENMGYITKNLNLIKQEQLRENNSNNYNYDNDNNYSYSRLTNEQEFFKKYTKTSDDINMESIEMIKALPAADEYEKFNLDRAVISRSEFLKSLTPEFKAEQEANKNKLVQRYHDSLADFEAGKSGMFDEDKNLMFRTRMNQAASAKQYEKDMKRLNDEKKMEQEDEEDAKVVKRTNPKSVEKELSVLKSIFSDGNRK